jgi:chloramphenicol 3-O phosphotransferase
MALQGNNLIVDDVLLGNEKKEYAQLLSDLEAYFVGLFAPLEILEAREQARGDRLIGLARWEYDKVHEGMRYDLEIDTSSATPLECARLISKKFQL